jgi:GDP-4-dehydro-6-deoxy-D-mannose reductase
MVSKLLVTGMNGFVGQHIQRQLPGDWQLMDAQRLDLLASESLDFSLAQDCPDAVIHLAGQTFVPESFRDPQHTLEVNLLGTLNLLQALKRKGFSGSFLYVSSGDVYGQVSEDNLPIGEQLTPRPRNPYAVSKVAAESLCLQWSYAEPWRIMVARPFNHIGPGQRADFVVPGIARQLVRIRKGLQAPSLDVGDIDVTRDFLDVRDVISAYFHLLRSGRSGEIYNVCSGREQSVRDLINQLVGLEGVQVELTQDHTRLRPSEQRRVVGCSQKIQKETGWKPEISITQTLQSVLSDWEEREAQQ